MRLDSNVKKVIPVVIIAVFMLGCIDGEGATGDVVLKMSNCGGDSSCILEAAAACSPAEFFGEIPVVLDYKYYNAQIGYKNLSFKIQSGNSNACNLWIKLSGARKEGYLGSLETKLYSPVYEQPFTCTKTGEEVKTLLEYYFQERRFSSKLYLPSGCTAEGEYVPDSDQKYISNGDVFLVVVYTLTSDNLRLAIENIPHDKIRINSITLSGDATGSCRSSAEHEYYGCPTGFKRIYQTTFMIPIDPALTPGDIISFATTINYDKYDGEKGKTDIIKFFNVQVT